MNACSGMIAVKKDFMQKRTGASSHLATLSLRSPRAVFDSFKPTILLIPFEQEAYLTNAMMRAVIDKHDDATSNFRGALLARREGIFETRNKDRYLWDQEQRLRIPN